VLVEGEYTAVVCPAAMGKEKKVLEKKILSEKEHREHMKLS